MRHSADPIDRLVDAIGAMEAAAQARDAGALADASETLRRNVENLTRSVGASPESGDTRLPDAASRLAAARDQLLVAAELNRRLLRAWSEITGVDAISSAHTMAARRFGSKGSMQLAW